MNNFKILDKFSLWNADILKRDYTRILYKTNEIVRIHSPENYKYAVEIETET